MPYKPVVDQKEIWETGSPCSPIEGLNVTRHLLASRLEHAQNHSSATPEEAGRCGMVRPEGGPNATVKIRLATEKNPRRNRTAARTIEGKWPELAQRNRRPKTTSPTTIYPNKRPNVKRQVRG